MRISEVYHYQGYVEPTIQEHPMLVSNETIGIEIELERVTGNPIRSRYWEQVDDGSLRNNGKEFIFRGPLGGVDLFTAIAEASKHFHTIGPEPSWRCSTHAHLNIRNMTIKQLRNLLLAFIVYEKPMFKCSGMNRYKNNFCPAYGFAQDQLMILSKNWKRDDSTFLQNVVSSWSKYTALNLLPISSKGSVEFRIANAMTTSGSLLRLANRILLLKKIAMEWEGTEEELINHLATQDVTKVFNKKLTGFLEDPITQEDVEEGVVNAFDVLKLQTYRHVTSGSDSVPTILNRSKVISMVDVAHDRARNISQDNRQEWVEFHQELADILEQESWDTISISLARKIKQKFLVSWGYLISQDMVELVLSEQ